MTQSPAPTDDIGRFQYMVIDGKYAYIIASWTKCFFWQIKNNRMMDTWIVNESTSLIQADRRGLY